MEYNEFIAILQQTTQTSPAELTPRNRMENLKRSKDRDIPLYTLRDLDRIQYYDEHEGTLRYAVSSAFEFIIAEEGRPSKFIPQHREMCQANGCIAAGNLLISDTNPRTITAITFESGDYHPTVGTLLWPLTILSLHPQLLHPDFKILIHQMNSQHEFVPMHTFDMPDMDAEIWLPPATRSTRLLKRNICSADVFMQASRISYTERTAHTSIADISIFTKKRKADWRYTSPPQKVANEQTSSSSHIALPAPKNLFG